MFMSVTTGFELNFGRKLFFQRFACALPQPCDGQIVNVFGSKISETHVAPNTIISLTCTVGYNLYGGDQSATCNEDGSWSYRLGRCRQGSFQIHYGHQSIFIKLKFI